MFDSRYVKIKFYSWISDKIRS